MKRRKMSKRKSRKVFAKGNGVHYKNNAGAMVRGGYRL